MFIYDKIVKYLEPRDVFNASMKMHEDESVCEWHTKLCVQSVVHVQYSTLSVRHGMIGAGTKFLITKFLSNKVPK
jgi:hypothetical protein